MLFVHHLALDEIGPERVVGDHRVGPVPLRGLALVDEILIQLGLPNDAPAFLDPLEELRAPLCKGCKTKYRGRRMP